MRTITVFIMFLVAVIATFLLLGGTVESMLTIPMMDIHNLEKSFFETNAISSDIKEEALLKARFYLLAIQNVWILWLVPVIGMAFFVLLLGQMKRVGETKLAEQVYFLEQNLERVTKLEAEDRYKLELQRESLFHAFEGSSDSLLHISEEGSIENLNPAANGLLARINNSQEQQFSRRLLKDVIPHFTASPLDRVVKDALIRKKAWQGEVEIPQVGIWLDVIVYMAEEGVYLLLKDVSDQRKSGTEKQVGEGVVRQLTEAAPNSFAITDASWRYMYVSGGWEQMFKVHRADIIGHPHSVVAPDFYKQIENFLGRLNQGRSIERVNHLMTIHGSECWLNIKIQPWYTPFGKIGGYIMFVENVTEVQQARMRLSHLEEQENRLAYNDLLTGLPNRQLFYDRLNMALATAYRQLNKVGLMFLDLDGFKAVNDKLGHDVGDMLLKAVAERIQACVRETDTVSRLGGDEFTVIASVQNEQDFSLIAQKIIDNVNKPFDLGPHRGVHIGTSIGISLYPQHGGAANDLIRKADTAMYVAKNGGKNRFCVFEDSMIEEGEREDL